MFTIQCFTLLKSVLQDDIYHCSADNLLIFFVNIKDLDSQCSVLDNLVGYNSLEYVQVAGSYVSEEKLAQEEDQQEQSLETDSL